MYDETSKAQYMSKAKARRNLILQKITFAIVTMISLGISFMIINKMLYNGGVPGINERVDENRFEIERKIEIAEIVRGNILDSRGDYICYSEVPGVDTECLLESYALMIGYDNQVWGSHGIKDCFKEELEYGTDLKLTTINSFQNASYNVLCDNVGSCIILENETGRILALASREPIAFDPNNMTSESMKKYNSYDGYWLLNGVTEKDPPGSVFKLITSASAIENDIELDDYKDIGYFKLEDGTKIKNVNGGRYGKIDFSTAFKKSVNAYFINLGVNGIGSEKLQETMRDFGFDDTIDLDFGCQMKAEYSIISQFDLAMTSFGQGKTCICPLQLAMIGQSIANDGEKMKPYMIEQIGEKSYSKPQSLGRSCSRKTARQLKEVMATAATEYGLVNPKGEYLGAKTGTAEVENGKKNHTYLLVITDEYTILLNYDRTNNTSMKLIKPMNKLLEKIYQ